MKPVQGSIKRLVRGRLKRDYVTVLYGEMRMYFVDQFGLLDSLMLLVNPAT